MNSSVWVICWRSARTTPTAGGVAGAGCALEACGARLRATKSASALAQKIRDIRPSGGEAASEFAAPRSPPTCSRVERCPERDVVTRQLRCCGPRCLKTRVAYCLPASVVCPLLSLSSGSCPAESWKQDARKRAAPGLVPVLREFPRQAVVRSRIRAKARSAGHESAGGIASDGLGFPLQERLRLDLRPFSDELEQGRTRNQNTRRGPRLSPACGCFDRCCRGCDRRSSPCPNREPYGLACVSSASARKAPMASSACAAAFNLPMLPGNPCGIPRDGEQVLLALAAGDLDQVACGQARGLGQDRPGNRDLVVAGALPNHLARRIIDRRQMPPQLDQRLGLDALDQVAKDVVEQADLRLIEAVGIVEKQVGDTPKRFDAFLGRAAFDRVLELDNQRLLRAHFPIPSRTWSRGRDCNL